MLLSKRLLSTWMFCVACGLPISVYAQPGVSGSSVAASVSGTLFDGTTYVGFNSGQEHETAYTGAAILLLDEAVQHGGAVGIGTVEVDASPGRLRVLIEGQARAQGYLQTATSNVTATASFFDTITKLSQPPGAAEIPVGKVIIVNGSMKLSGDFNAQGVGVLSNSYNTPASDYQQGLGKVSLRIEGVGDGPYGFGEFGQLEKGYVSRFPQTVRDATFVYKPVPATVPWTRAFVWGVPNNIQVAMTLDGNAYAQDYYAGGNDEASGYFFADFSRTLTWGGISSITRYDTGEVLTDVTVSSASGFDYSRPFVPPVGDYNGNGVVDAADFTVWQDSLGQTGAGLAADGDGNSQIDSDDYAVWKAHFDQTGGSVAAPSFAEPLSPAVPEPSSLLLAATAAILLVRRRHERANP